MRTKKPQEALQEKKKMKMTALAVGGIAALILMTGVAILVSAGSVPDSPIMGSKTDFADKVQKAIGGPIRERTRDQTRNGSCGVTDPEQVRERTRDQTPNGSCGGTDPEQVRERTRDQTLNGSCGGTDPEQVREQTRDQIRDESCESQDVQPGSGSDVSGGNGEAQQSGQRDQDRDRDSDGSGPRNRNSGY
jgi:hypothetical protein